MKLWEVTNGRSYREWQFEGFDMTPKVYVIAMTEEGAIERAKEAFEAKREDLLSDLEDDERKGKEAMIEIEHPKNNQVNDWYIWACCWTKNLKAFEITDRCSHVICDW